jgi:putative glutamine amidotransferase
MPRPLIGITGRRWIAPKVGGFPDNFAGVGIDLHVANYPDCVALAGGLPVELTRSADIDDVVTRMDGIVLTGGADVDPTGYGVDAHPATTAVEPDRDRFEIAVFEAALRHRVPVLAVCRGLQIVNVARGGTLVQHLERGVEGITEHHAAWDQPADALVHSLATSEGSLAAQLYGPASLVNSLHHQAAELLGAGLVATGWSPDGVIECLELDDFEVLAVQWHPELVVAQPDPSFTWLVSRGAARRH